MMSFSFVLVILMEIDIQFSILNINFDNHKECITFSLFQMCCFISYTLFMIGLGIELAMPRGGNMENKKGAGGLDPNKGTFSILKGHLTLPKSNPPLKTFRISATSFFDSFFFKYILIKELPFFRKWGS